MAKHIRGPTGKVTQQWLSVYNGIHAMRDEQIAPVDIEGVQCSGDRSAEPKVWRFQTLLSLMLSSQTRDTVNHDVMERLKAKGFTLDKILRTSERVLAKEIYGVSFHNTKAKHIKRTAEILHTQFAGEVPDTLEELLTLPGIGPKMALLILSICYDKVDGIAVDTHVHRISNRLDWVSTKTPEQTRKSLESYVPKQYWENINLLLVGFGQTICTPTYPKCGKCKIRNLCPIGNGTKLEKSLSKT